MPSKDPLGQGSSPPKAHPRWFDRNLAVPAESWALQTQTLAPCLCVLGSLPLLALPRLAPGQHEHVTPSGAGTPALLEEGLSVRAGCHINNNKQVSLIISTPPPPPHTASRPSPISPHPGSHVYQLREGRRVAFSKQG